MDELPLALEARASMRVVDGRAPVRLDDVGTSPPTGVDKKAAREHVARAQDALRRLQEMLFGARDRSLLLVFQGMDASGKGGVIRNVLGALGPGAVRATSFGVPTSHEAAHDFLWRIHLHVPPRGRIAAFDRSHYEDIIAPRVRKLAPRETWEPRHEDIVAFERLLVREGTIVRKFFLHISHDEQDARLRAREESLHKAWKLAVGDWHDRALWDEHRAAYDETMTRTATPDAPWIVVPADAKWWRDAVVAQAIVDALAPHAPRWREHLEALAKAQLGEIRAWREKNGG